MEKDAIDDGPALPSPMDGVVPITDGIPGSSSGSSSNSTLSPSPLSPMHPPQQQKLESNSATASITDEEEIKQIIDMLRGDDVAGRIAAANKLEAVAIAIGEKRTRDELIPFITDGIDDEDEVLLAISKSLGRLIHYIGDTSQHAVLLLQPLELLLTVEEIIVREEALKSADILSAVLPTEVYNNQFVNMIIKLASKEWFTARISSISLIVNSYEAIASKDQQEKFISLFCDLCTDDTPMVRRIASQNLGLFLSKIINSIISKNSNSNDNENDVHMKDDKDILDSISNILDLNDGIISKKFLPLYEELASTDQPDSVRLQTTENCVHYGHTIYKLIEFKHRILQQQQQQTTTTNKKVIIDSPSSSSDDDNSNNTYKNEITLIEKILPLIVSTIDDRSWRVRWTAACKFADIVNSYDFMLSSIDILIPAYEKLLQDPEAEVRTAATMNLSKVGSCSTNVSAVSSTTTTTTTDNNNNDNRQSSSTSTTINNSNTRPDSDNNNTSSSQQQSESNTNTGSTANETSSSTDQQQQQQDTDKSKRISVAQRLAKRVTLLTEDDNEHVRAALAMVATELAPVLGKDATIMHLVPPVLLLLRDAASEVRLNLISSLGALNEVIGIDLLSQSLLPAILDLAQDGKWRIRLAIIQHIPLLAKQLGKEFFSAKLSSLCVGWLADDISTIRMAASESLMELTKLFGTNWAIEYLLPSIQEIRKHPSYLRRLVAVQACSLMSTVMDSSIVIVEILPILIDMATDPVPNIRFNVAKGLEKLGPVCGLHVYETQIRPILILLKTNDLDRDVRFYATKTLDSLEERFGSSSGGT